MYLNIPGLKNSGPQHWQTHLEKKYPNDFQRVLQDNWDSPNCSDWIIRLEEVLSQQPLEDVILIGHSVGCATIVNWFGKYQHRIKGAMLVAPSDVERGDYPQYITGFFPLYLKELPFPSIVVGSTDDHVVDFERAEYFAGLWGSDFVEVENGGHLEGAWEEAFEVLLRLENRV